MNKPKHSFFCSDIDSTYLSEEESKHAIRVLRLKNDDAIILLDGKGRKCIAKIISADKNNLQFEIIECFRDNTDQLDIHIAIAPTKSNDRFAFFIEKVAEIGIQEITPIICTNSERQSVKIEKLEKNLVSALKQSGNLFLPIIHESRSFKDFIHESEGRADQCFIAHCEENEEKIELKKIAKPNKKVVILIGPEGDFSSEEIKLAIDKGFIPVGLGNSRLRTETAGIVACHTLHVI